MTYRTTQRSQKFSHNSQLQSSVQNVHWLGFGSFKQVISDYSNLLGGFPINQCHWMMISTPNSICSEVKEDQKAGLRKARDDKTSSRAWLING